MRHEVRRVLVKDHCLGHVHSGWRMALSTGPNQSSIHCPMLCRPISHAMDVGCGGCATGLRLPSLLLSGASPAICRCRGLTGPIRGRGTICRGTWRSRSRPSTGPHVWRARGSIPYGSLAGLHGCCPRRTRSCQGDSPLHGRYSTSRNCCIGSSVWRADGIDDR